MFRTIRNAWKVEELKRKILFTLFIILLYRIGNAVPVPYVNVSLLSEYFNSLQNTVLGLYNVMSGSSFSHATIFALSIQPYINASIIIQLLTIAIPALERLAKEGGEEGKEKINKITRYSTVAIGLIQGFAYYVLIKNNSLLASDGTGIWPAIVIIATFTAGSALLMWLGEQITEKGIGNGISVILLINIVAGFPEDFGGLFDRFVINAGSIGRGVVGTVVILAVVVLLVVLVILLQDAQRKIQVQYAQKTQGRRMVGGQSSFIPLKINTAGVIPVIFAVSLLQTPLIISSLFGVSGDPTGNVWQKILMYMNQQNWCKFRTPGYGIYTIGLIFYVLMLYFFAYFYTGITFNPIEVSNNLKKQGGFVPGIRPGRPTSDYLTKVLNYVILIGATGLTIIALIPILFTGLFSARVSFGGTSIIIIVGVILEMISQVETMMRERHYKGFLSED